MLRRNNVTKHIFRLEQQANKLASENELLHKEVDRLKYLEVLRYSAVHQSTNPVLHVRKFESRHSEASILVAKLGTLLDTVLIGQDIIRLFDEKTK